MRKPDTTDVGDGGTFPLNIHEIKKLKGKDKVDAMKNYHKWLKKQREEDKRLSGNQHNRSYYRESRELKRKYNMPRAKGKSRCLDCGKKISKYSFRCHPCNAKVQTGRKKAMVGGFGGKGRRRSKKKDMRKKKKK